MELAHHPDPLLSDPLHELIGYAVCDAELQNLLLTNPRKAATLFGLKGDDLRVAAGVRGARNIAEYAIKLEQRFAGISHPGRVAVQRQTKQRKQSTRKAS